MTGEDNPAATPDHAAMREAWVQWAVAILEEE